MNKTELENMLKSVKAIQSSVDTMAQILQWEINNYKEVLSSTNLVDNSSN